VAEFLKIRVTVNEKILLGKIPAGAEEGNGGSWRGAGRSTPPRQAEPIAFDTSENPRGEPGLEHFPVARYPGAIGRKYIAGLGDYRSSWIASRVSASKRGPGREWRRWWEGLLSPGNG